MGNVCSSKSSTDVVVPNGKAGAKPSKSLKDQESENASDIDEAEYAQEELDSDLEDEKANTYSRSRREPISEEEMMKMDDAGGEKFMATRPYVGAIVAPDGAEEDDLNPFEDKILNLQYAHGFRGCDTRDNLHVNVEGQLVYHTAGLGVVLNPVTHEQKHYHGHNDDVVSLTIHPEKKIVASGQVGKDPRICVWDSTDMESYSILAGRHTRAVTELAFSANGKYLASVGADDDHTVVVWDWEESKVVAECATGGAKVYGLAWSDVEDNVFCTVGEKNAKFWKLEGSSLTYKKGIFGRVGPIESILSVKYWKGWAISGTTNGSIYIWKDRNLTLAVAKPHVNSLYIIQVVGDIIWTSGKDGKLKKWAWSEKEAKCIKTWDIKQTLGQSAPIQSISPLGSDGNSIVLGTRTGNVYELNTVEDSLKAHVQGHAKGELWGLATHPKNRSYATISDDGFVSTWSVDSYRQIKTTKIGTPCRTIAYSPSGDLLAIGAQNGKWYVIDAETHDVLATGSTGKKAATDIKFSPDGEKFAVAGADRQIEIYSGSGKKWSKSAVCKGHTATVTHFDWDVDSSTLQSNCSGYELLFWNAESGKQITSASSVANTKWATQTCILGWSVQGIWPKFSDGTDINAVDASTNKFKLAAADDFGKLVVHKFPCTKEGGPSLTGHGHSAHVTNAKWTCDDQHIITTGGGDASILQWTIETKE